MFLERFYCVSNFLGNKYVLVEAFANFSLISFLNSYSSYSIKSLTNVGFNRSFPHAFAMKLPFFVHFSLLALPLISLRLSRRNSYGN